MGATMWPDEFESQLFSMLNNDDRQFTGCSPKETSSQMLEPLGLGDETALGASEVQQPKASSEPSNGLLAWQPVVRIGAWVRAWVSGLLHTSQRNAETKFVSERCFNVKRRTQNTRPIEASTGGTDARCGRLTAPLQAFTTTRPITALSHPLTPSDSVGCRIAGQIW